ncbi:uroporphyrinogen decarboxylase [Geminicoccaceae bacterium 1502E]|nr:uroporphyrinogen decarboxylase [Geminicoccaceae bacterium 1502E]
MPRKRLLARLAGETEGRPPVWLMRQAGRYLPEYRDVRAQAGGFLDLCYTPELAVEVTLQPIRRFGFDASILFSDILVVPHALGAGLRFVEGEGPRLEPLRSRKDLDRLDPTRLHTHLEPVYETVRRLRRELPGEVTLIGFAGAPWTLAAYMVEGGGSRDYAVARAFARQERGLFQELIDLLTDCVIDYLDAQARAGAEALQIFDSWAGVLSPGEQRRWCLEPARRIVAALRERHPHVPVLLFPRGVGPGYATFAAESGCGALSLDTSLPMEWAAREVGHGTRLCLQGNLDPVALLGPERDMLDEAAAIVHAARGRPLIFNLGHGVLQQTAPEKVGALVRYLQSLPG